MPSSLNVVMLATSVLFVRINSYSIMRYEGSSQSESKSLKDSNIIIKILLIQIKLKKSKKIIFKIMKYLLF